MKRLLLALSLLVFAASCDGDAYAHDVVVFGSRNLTSQAVAAQLAADRAYNRALFGQDFVVVDSFGRVVSRNGLSRNNAVVFRNGHRANDVVVFQNGRNVRVNPRVSVSRSFQSNRGPVFSSRSVDVNRNGFFGGFQRSVQINRVR